MKAYLFLLLGVDGLFLYFMFVCPNNFMAVVAHFFLH